MNYELLADITTFVHTILILGVILGILLSVRFKRFRPVESVALLVAVIIWSIYDGCPLTYLENFFRIQAGHPISLLDNGFISFYTHQWLGFDISNQTVVVITYITAIAFFLISIEWIGQYFHIKIPRLFKSSKIG